MFSRKVSRIINDYEKDNVNRAFKQMVFKEQNNVNEQVGVQY